MSEYLESIKNYRFLRDNHPRIFNLIEKIWEGAREQEAYGYDDMNPFTFSDLDNFLKNGEIFKEILICFNIKLEEIVKW